MDEYQDSSKETQEGKQQDRVREFLSRPEVTGIAIAIWFFLGGLFLLRLYIYDHIPTDPGRTAVLVESMFSLAIVIVVVVHAVMYLRQAKAMDAQLRVSDTSLVTSNQAYVGIHSIEDHNLSDGRAILMKLENIGRVPADNISISMYLSGLLIDREVIKKDVRDKFVHDINEYFGRTKLFPGSLKIEIVIPYDKYVFAAERVLNDKGDMAFHLWGKIIYNDGFGKGKETEFSFYRSRAGRWLVAAPWSPDVIKMLDSQKSGRPKKQNPN